MSAFAVFSPKGATPDTAPERLRFVPERPSLWALVAPPVWLVARRLWLLLLFWLVATMTLVVLVQPLAPDLAGWCVLLFWIWFAVSARDLEQASLARAGWTLEGVVEADGLRDAERLFFTRHLERATDTEPAAPTARRAPARAGTPRVLGFEGFEKDRP